MANPQFVKDLIDAGIHFGHRQSRWNPKMKPFIYGKRNLIHIIDVRETLKGVLAAKRFLNRLIASGKDIVFVGTKRQARSVIEEVGKRSGMPYVAERWLGGTLTNYRTIRSRLQRLEELEAILQSPDISKNYSKKMESSLKREYRKILRNLSGIRTMDRLPGALFVVDVKRERNAIKEAQKLRIPVIALIDTDSDPDEVDIAIPGNDDAMRAIELILKEVGDAVVEGKAGRDVREEDKGGGGERGSERAPRRRRPTSTSVAEAEAASAEKPQPEEPTSPAPSPASDA
ncbi:MAG: 30S ribosomal protein S2 [Phycisphaerales bacterium]|nr:30S ribosomal protein S2 [Phycisphaerales bacterium]